MMIFPRTGIFTPGLKLKPVVSVVVKIWGTVVMWGRTGLIAGAAEQKFGSVISR